MNKENHFDPYEILQVSPDAELEVIHAAYRRLALKYHPDHGATGDAEHMKLLNRAKDILLNAEKKAVFDAARTEPLAEVSCDGESGKGVSLKLVLIPAGEFNMGEDETPEQVAKKCNGVEWEADRFQREQQPQHRVKITKPFYMGVYVVTQWQYEAVMGENPSCFKGESNPVEGVSWYNAVEFCKKLSAKTGQTVRLPTEAEWEYACRAGTTTPFNTGETISTDQANYNGNYTYGTGRKGENRHKTLAVGSFAPNAWGLYDMHGNVGEWCQDCYAADYYKNSPIDDPSVPEKGESRVLRGGSWYSIPRRCRSAFRVGGDPRTRSDIIGFRVVCAPRP